MAYSYTERKRIRKNFGSRDSVLEIPYLLQMQKDAYTAFLQADVPPKKRTREGLQAAFEAAFPIISHNGFVEMKYLEYNLAKPGFQHHDDDHREPQWDEESGRGPGLCKVDGRGGSGAHADTVPALRPERIGVRMEPSTPGWRSPRPRSRSVGRWQHHPDVTDLRHQWRRERAP